MNLNQKGFAKVALIAVIITTISVSGYFILVKKSTPTAQQTSVSTPTLKNEMADWKTYTNEKYGFKIQLPDDWQTKEDSKYNFVSFNSQEKFNAITKHNDSEVNGGGMSDNVTISYYKDDAEYISQIGYQFQKLPTLEEYINQNSDVRNLQTINFAGQSAFRANVNGMFDEDVIWVRKDKHLYIIRLVGVGNPLGNEILSTFKFTK